MDKLMSGVIVKVWVPNIISHTDQFHSLLEYYPKSSYTHILPECIKTLKCSADISMVSLPIVLIQIGDCIVYVWLRSDQNLTSWAVRSGGYAQGPLQSWSLGIVGHIWGIEKSITFSRRPDRHLSESPSTFPLCSELMHLHMHLVWHR